MDILKENLAKVIPMARLIFELQLCSSIVYDIRYPRDRERQDRGNLEHMERCNECQIKSAISHIKKMNNTSTKERTKQIRKE